MELSPATLPEFPLPAPSWLIFALGLGGVIAARRSSARSNQRAEGQEGAAFGLLAWLMERYRALFRLDYQVKGAAALPAGPEILAANHPNITDVVFLPFFLPENPVMVMQGNLFKIPIIGRLLARSGQIPVRRERPTQAFDRACELLRKGRSIWIFPEGRLNPDGESLPAGSGAVRMSLATGAPIIPIGIHVADQDTLHLSLRSWSGLHKGRLQVRGTCYFQFGEKWDPARESGFGRAKTPVRRLTAKLMEKINSLAKTAGSSIPPGADNECLAN